jgi:hypothetical protein
LSASHPGRSTPEEKASGTHWMGSWVSPRAGLNDVEKRKVSAPAMNRTPAVQPVPLSVPTELSRHVQLYHTFLTDVGFHLHLGRVVVNWHGATLNPFNDLSTTIIKML